MKSSLSSAMEQRNSSNFNSKIKPPSSPSIARSLHPFFIRTSRFISPFSSSSSTSCSSSSSSYPSSSSSSSRHEFPSILRFLSSLRCFSADDVHFAGAKSTDNRIAKLSLLERDSEHPSTAQVRVFRSFRSNRNSTQNPDLIISARSDSNNLSLLLETEEAVEQCIPESGKVERREMALSDCRSRLERREMALSECSSKVKSREMALPECSNKVERREMPLSECSSKAERREITLSECSSKVKEPTTEEMEKVNVNDMMKDSVAKVQYTYDPCADFYESMREIVMQKGLTDLQQMEEMFACFVVLNSPKHHRHIQKAYTSLLARFFHGKIFTLPSSSAYSFSSSSGCGALQSSQQRI